MQLNTNKEQTSTEKVAVHTIFSRSMEGNGVKLAVEESKNRDVGRGIARIDQRTMQRLGISAGDVIEIEGKRKTSAIAWPAYSEDKTVTSYG